jgi:hypothetical protein
MELRPKFPVQESAPNQVTPSESELQRLIPTIRRNHRALLGFFNEQEVRQFLQGKAQSEDQYKEFMQRWGTLRSRINNLPPLSAEPEVRPILEPDALLEIEKAMEGPECKAAFPEGSWSVSLVQLSGIIAFQPSVDVNYALDDGGTSLNPTDLLPAVRLCFPCNRPTALAVTMDQAQKAIMVSGVNPSLQVVGLNCNQAQPMGPFAVTFFISTGPNILQVSRYRGRYFLSNGYHRAYRFMNAGFTHVPCLLRNAADLAQTGALGPGFFSESILMSSRPPLLTDFTDEALGVNVPVHAVKKTVRIRPDEFLALG